MLFVTFSYIFLVSFTLVSCAVLHDDVSNQNDISGRGIDAKGILASLAGNLMSRGFAPTAAGSQVISLNLTNLLVLVLLKALIFAAGSLGAGNWKNELGRSNNDEPFVTEEEILLYLSYLTGEESCLQNVACRQPEQAKKYVTAGETLIKASQMFGLDADRHYQKVLQEVQEAVDVANTNGDCSRFSCTKET